MTGHALLCLSSLAALVAALPACGDGAPVARGFGSREVLPIREPSVYLRQSNDNSVVYSTSNDAGTASNYWSVDLTTGQVQAQSPPDGGPGTGNGCVCELSIGGDAATGTFTATDPATGQEKSIDGVAAIVQCPCGAATEATVLRPDATGGLGIFTIDLGTLETTEVVPATLGTATWAKGAASTGSLASSSLLSTSTVTPIAGHYVYPRTMGDGSTVMFAGTFASGSASELALFEIAAAATVVRFPVIYTVEGTAVGLVAWQVQDSASQAVALEVWDDEHQQVVSCSLPAPLPQVGVASPDGTEVFLGATTAWDPREPGGPYGALVLVSRAGSGTCTFLGSIATNAGFSLDGSLAFWMVGDTLSIGAADGGGARQIVGNIYQPHFAVGTEMEFFLGNDLVWEEATDASNNLTYVAEQVFGPIYDIDPTDAFAEGSWLVGGYDFNSQDSTGTLGVLNRDSNGTKRLISPEVDQYLVSRAPPADGGAPMVQVVYLVRGRNPSPQDGLWVATINVADLH